MVYRSRRHRAPFITLMNVMFQKNICLLVWMDGWMSADPFASLPIHNRNEIKAERRYF